VPISTIGDYLQRIWEAGLIRPLPEGLGEWHGLLGDATVADAILGRLVHGACRIDLAGESLRRT
jgi:hypothetical protein